MENNFVMKKNEIALWVSIIILAMLADQLNKKYLIILICWVVVIICIGNAKRFYSKTHVIPSILVRRSMYVIPFFLPLITNFRLSIKGDFLICWCIIGCISGILLILPKKNDWSILLSKDMIGFSNVRAKFDYYTQIYMLIGAAIGEEIFFRNFVVGYVNNVSVILSVILSCGLFFLNHFSVKWNSAFKVYDYTIQIIFSILSSMLFIMSKSILPSIIAHITYNLPPILLAVKSYIYYYGYKSEGSLE